MVKIFKRYEKINKYKTKDKQVKVIDKYISYRKNEKFRSGIKHYIFCNATINQKKKSGYLFKRGHSKECNNYLNLIIASIIKRKKIKNLVKKLLQKKVGKS